jgi:hypothetical protein
MRIRPVRAADAAAVAAVAALLGELGYRSRGYVYQGGTSSRFLRELWDCAG